MKTRVLGFTTLVVAVGLLVASISWMQRPAEAPAERVGFGAAAQFGAAPQAAPAVANPDTAVLSKLVNGAGVGLAGSLNEKIVLRDGTLTLAPDVSVRAVAADRAVALTKAEGIATAPQNCRSGLLTDTDIYDMNDHHLLYVDHPVWMCVQLNVQAVSSHSAEMQSTNVMTFVDVKSGAVLFTVQDTA